MPKYIDADKLKGSILAGVINPQHAFTAECICDAIDETDEADVHEIKHGMWKEDDYGFYHCDQCMWEFDEPENSAYNYCPDCGAKMDKKDGEQ